MHDVKCLYHTPLLRAERDWSITLPPVKYESMWNILQLRKTRNIQVENSTNTDGVHHYAWKISSSLRLPIKKASPSKQLVPTPSGWGKAWHLVLTREETGQDPLPWHKTERGESRSSPTPTSKASIMMLPNSCSDKQSPSTKVLHPIFQRITSPLLT